MKSFVPLAAGIVAAGSFVGGCATSSPPDQARDDGVDHPRVASVERAARGRGVDVHWVHFPRRASDAAPAATAPVPAGT